MIRRVPRREKTAIEKLARSRRGVSMQESFTKGALSQKKWLMFWLQKGNWKTTIDRPIRNAKLSPHEPSTN